MAKKLAEDNAAYELYMEELAAFEELLCQRRQEKTGKRKRAGKEQDDYMDEARCHS